VVAKAGDEIPFLLELPGNCKTDAAAILNGDERISVLCQRLGDRLLLDFPVYGTRILAKAGKRGVLSGHWEPTAVGISGDRMQFGAVPLDELNGRHRFPQPVLSSRESRGESRPDVSGIWRIELETRGLAKGVFEQVGPGVLHGSVEVPAEYGDLRFLAGDLHGSDLRMSTFDGGSAHLLRGHLGTDGRMEGQILGSAGMRDGFIAERSEDFVLVDPLQQVRVMSAERQLNIGPLLNPRYADKAVILEVFGTWCSTCNDLAPLLVELDREYRDDGLEILSLAYEISNDEAYNRARVSAYKAKHGIGWEVVLADEPPEALFATGPAELSPMGGVPIAIFLNRDRTIHAIYAGFSSPATGETHRKGVTTFRRLTKEILGSRGR
jgi:thiol-disulfide isomerase/thioredoxin